MPIRNVQRAERAISAFAERMEGALRGWLPRADEPEGRLCEAMRYAALGGGKYLRPYLVEESAAMFGVSPTSRMRVGAAVEMVHAYSLIHDDLPAMDDDDLRRGKASCHVAFGEATAILAGDALLSLAFETLAFSDTHPDGGVRSELVLELARASGARGMTGGQMIDLESEGAPADDDEVFRMARLKTGALFAFSAAAGAILGQAAPDERATLNAFGSELGLAFQIVDDLLDVEGDERDLGKKVGKDAEAGKATFVSVFGAKEARAEARRAADRACARLDAFQARADGLRALAELALNRDR